MRRNIVTSVFMFIILFYLSGCSLLPKPTTQEVIIKGIENNKSIVIMPVYYPYGTKMIWGKVGEKKRYIPLINPDILNKQHFADGSLLNNNYQAFVMDDGVYYIKDFSSSIEESAYALKLPRSSADTKKFKSTIGNIRIEKTPERERTNGKREEVTSYYKMEYNFVNKDNIDDTKSVGTIIINPNEIVLIPAVWIDIKIANDSCEFEDEEWFLFEILDIITTPSAIFYGNDEETWYWSCPIKSITINIKTKSKEDFLSGIVSNPFYADKFDNITIRNFEFGEMFKNAKKMESLEDGIERYIIDGSADK